ncbi:thioredoxin-like protein [Polychytrium aggregatum]|uniref:thioredoxin-like protein n=1 Tax=Polychytrium aggregatum TaxID=110093 RepID=UPI0022FE30E4|nr:thioredoxin-like protein [Polychytrium aggregatum]KAI9202941.1 thioredoxin-like protein [Polychytrium aggregatum]
MAPIEVNHRIPSATFGHSGNPEEVGACARPSTISSDELFNNKKVVIFAVPFAYSPGCQGTHVPGFLEHYDQIKAKGVDTVACVSTDSVWVMDAWGKALGVGSKILMLSDAHAEFFDKLGLTVDSTASPRAGFYLKRPERFALIVDNGTVKYVGVDARDIQRSAAATVLANL